MALKTCTVSWFDLKEVKHTVEVSAGSVYEAMAQALRIFRDNEWVEDIGHGQTPITVKVKNPEIEHMVRVQDFERGLEASPRSPAEMITQHPASKFPLSSNHRGSGADRREEL